MPYSPLGRGLLTGGITATPGEGDSRATAYFPRFQGDNLATNLALVEEVKAIAGAKGVTPGQARAGLGARPGRRRGADPRHQAGEVPRGERRRARRRVSPRTTWRHWRPRCRRAPWPGSGTAT
nr:hypothetical protein [Nocardioides convexus]